MKKYLIGILTFILFFGFNTNRAYAQEETITGTVRDEGGEELPGVSIIIKGTTTGTVTDISGKYTVKAEKDDILLFSFVGFETQEHKVESSRTIDVTLKSNTSELEEVMVVGSRNTGRTVIESPVPVDIISPEDVITQTGKIQVTDMLRFAAPSFNASRQSGSDGSDHIVPATLRGLGPDQVLVLVNGKRRHQSSLVNLFGTRGRGNTGTDLNAIPQSSIKRIEVLRDGAAAQYGSDAIAGVINIVTKDGSSKPEATINYGFYNTNAPGDFPAGTPNTENNYLDDSQGAGRHEKKRPSFDGNSLKATINYGIKAGKRGGYVNFSGEVVNVKRLLRPGHDFRRGFGLPALKSFNAFVNSEFPLSDRTKMYVFGGQSYKLGDSHAFTRNPDDARTVASVFPKGFTPRITSNVVDRSIAMGIRTETESGWRIDLSNTYGSNKFHYYIKETINASLQQNSPSDFDAGGHFLSQNTTNLDFSKYYKNIFSGVNVAFGAVHRIENFSIFAGEEASYGIYDTTGTLIVDTKRQTPPTVNVKGTPTPRPGGSQGFPGYSPSNEVSRTRSNVAMYFDTEFDFTDKFLVGVAARYESYSDFGETLNGKLSARLKLTNKINLRGSISNGFRAPSLAQLYYNLKFTNVNASGVQKTLLSSNISPISRSYGINNLKQETSLGGSLGVTAKLGFLNASVDAYFINIKNRVLLTGYFPSTIAGVKQVQFFVNGADTRTFGVDIVLSAKKEFGNGHIFSASLTGNINNMSIDKILNDTLKESTFFGKRDQSFLLASAPNNKVIMNVSYEKKWFNMAFTFTRYSDVELVDYVENTDLYASKLVTDLVFGVQLNKGLKFSMGSNNLFNVYPSQQNDGEVEQGGYWDSVQMGFAGAYYFARLSYKF